jgi:hypothetical protein
MPHYKASEGFGIASTENFQEVLIRPSTILPFVFANTMISLALCVFILQFA